MMRTFLVDFLVEGLDDYADIFIRISHIEYWLFDCRLKKLLTVE